MAIWALRRDEPDTTIRLRLLPEGEGLTVRMLVRPIEGGDAIFAPGGGKEIVFGVVKDERLQTRRPLGDERTAAEAVIAACPSLRDSRGEQADLWEWRFPNANDCLALLRDLHPLRHKGVVLEWPKEEPYRLSGVASVTNTKLSLGTAGDWLTASGEVKVSDDLVLTMRQLLDLVATMPRGAEFVELGEGQFLALESDFRHYLEDMQSLAQPGKGDLVKLPPLAAIALEDFVEKTGSTVRSKSWKEKIENFRAARDHDPEVPATLQAELRSYQLEGYRWLSRLAMCGAGACLADDMGLGKTVQTLALLLERAPGGPALVVAPTSVAANWLEETIKFAPTLRPAIFGSGDRQVQLAEAGPFDLVICTYGLLQREEDALTKMQWHTVILDEAQAIKNSATNRSRAARNLQADFRVVTTGTPVENRLSELHTLFRFILPGYLGSWDHFRKNFADPIERDRDPVVRDRLRRLIHPFLLRRLKSGVLRDLPSRTEINLTIELSEPEAAFYEALRSRAVEELTATGAAKKAQEDPGKKAFMILAELTRLRRACCHPALVDPKVGKTISSAKLAAFSETVEEILAGRHQVLVFSQFVDHLALIRAELDEKGIAYQYLDGSTPTKKRKESVDAFQRGEGDVFLISLKAGGFGLNLTAADYVIHMDPWWNPATEDQASDRAHRIGQTRPVTIYRFITKGTIEEKIVALHHQKRELAESLLTGAEDANVRLSPEELLDLIRG
jgi:SNF2 family DNA or RNA helicase